MESIIIEVIDEVIAQHIATLRKKHKQLTYTDDYGMLVADKWFKEVDDFMINFIFPEVEYRTRNSIELLKSRDNDLSMILSRQFIIPKIHMNPDFNKEYSAQSEFSNESVDEMDPIKFELLCAMELERIGWEASLTSATGDNGIDIKAIKNGIYAVFQCKKYSSPVGISAVQEILAGKIFEDADQAYVVSNAGFTESAKLFASKTDVKLIHFSEIEKL